MGSNDANRNLCAWDHVQSTAAIKLNSTIILSLDFGPLLLTISGNLVFIITLIRTRSLHVPANVFLGALCISDLLVGVIVQPIFVFYNGVLITTMDSVTTRQLTRYTIAIGTGFSFVFASFVTADRYFAICHPFAYRKWVTCKSYIYAAIVASISYLLVIALCLSTQHYVLEMLAMIYGFCTLVATVAAYTRIYFVIMSKRLTQPNIGTLSNEERTRIRNEEKEKDKTLVIGVILLLLFLCYIPMFTTATMAIIRRNEFCTHRERTTIISLDVTFLVLTNSCLNPLVYFVRCSEMRKSAINILRKRRVNPLPA